MTTTIDVIERLGFSSKSAAENALQARIDAEEEGRGVVFKHNGKWAYRWYPDGADKFVPSLNNAEILPADIEDGEPSSNPEGNIGELLDYIAKPESGGNYEAYYLKAGNKDDPKLTSKKLSDLLVWQKQYGSKKGSSAAGRYQIIRKTLKGLIDAMDLNAATEAFNEDLQDRMAVKLLEGRGLKKYMSGKIGTETFCNNLAKEWAGLPVVTNLTNHKGKKIKAGQSYYAGDGLNEAGVDVASFLAIVKALKS